MKQYLVPATLAGALALTASVAGQTTPPASTSSSQTTAASAAGPVTVEGCLMREDDVPGRKSNVAEKVGVGEDYILTSTKMVKGTAPAGASSSGAVGTSGTTATTGATGTTGTTGAMYDINGIDDETLKRHVNRRVQVDGNFKSLDGGMKGDALIEIQATGIRPVSGDCPPK